MDFFEKASEEHQRKEKAKAYELKKTQWWRQQVGPGICYHCKLHFTKDKMTMDHLIPISRGGFSNKKNCVPSCKDCNTKKSYKTAFEMSFADLKAELKKD